jgi:hypothetical protein
MGEETWESSEPESSDLIALCQWLNCRGNNEESLNVTGDDSESNATSNFKDDKALKRLMTPADGIGSDAPNR